ncbi:hypothetical protein [Brevibacterium atlanticum]|uniref:hypothetical protein n=1 Tax=Brevibacterium atlanticum TaxID=2697563 RepID=UPI00141F7573|nr:hypothetical protein [Brevibacterium atlanticum]
MSMRNRGLARSTAAVSALVLTAAIAVVAMMPGRAGAAPNPLRGSETTHTIRIAADGTYTVRMDTTIDLALETSWGFGDEIHDGFRLPDTDALLPPYLRATYSHPRGSIDLTPVEATREKELHSVDIGFVTDDLDPGRHRGTLDYRVSGAAIPAAEITESRESTDGSDDGGVVVYFRPLERGTLTIESDVPITGVECEALAPHGEPCGEKTTDSWVVSAEEIERARPHTIDAVRITLDADPDGIDDPVIDS